MRERDAFWAAEQSRKLTLPGKAEDYKLGLPKDFQAPQGIEFQPNENDPILPQARAFALKHGLSQDAFHELVALDAASKIGSQQAIDNAKAAEVQKLGTNGVARKTAVDTWLKAMLGDDLGKEMSTYTFTAKQVQALETLMARMRSQGASGPQGGPREAPPDAERVSADQYAKMTAAERIDYARRFPQPMNGASR